MSSLIINSIGDGRFETNNLFFNGNSTLESIMAKRYAVRAIVFQYIYPLTVRNLAAAAGHDGPTYTIPEEQFHFYQDALTGYFLQEYADDLLTTEEKEHTVDVHEKVSFTGCGEMFGILAASRCGYKADDLLGLVAYYFSTLPEVGPSWTNKMTSTEYVCSPFTWEHEGIVNKHAKETTNLNKSGPVSISSYGKCIEDLTQSSKDGYCATHSAGNGICEAVSDGKFLTDNNS